LLFGQARRGERIDYLHQLGAHFERFEQEATVTLAMIVSERRSASALQTLRQTSQWWSPRQREVDAKDRKMATDSDFINGSAPTSISFGPFRLVPTQRLLTRSNKPLHVGSRAFDLLVALLERPGELVTKEDLMARAWPNTFVEPANLAVHIACLRRVLGDGRRGHRYVVNIPGRGYRFVAPITGSDNPESSGSNAAAPRRNHNLPAHSTRPVGRSDIIDHLTGQLPQGHLLTIVGPGGAGKTTVARAIAEKLIGAYEHGVWLLDLAPIDEPSLVAGALAAALGIEIGREDPGDALAAALEDKRLLLVFDNCEHVVASAAGLAARILRAAPGVQILATSRETLRCEGERLYSLPLLPSPASTHVSAKEAIEYPAVQMFIERAVSLLGEFELTDTDAPLVAEICRRLDGLPWAIELAAARIFTLGLRGVAERLDDCLDLLTRGRRTAPPRQQSLRASHDWTHALLSEAEQMVLRRLAIFTGGFTLRAALTVAGGVIDSVTEMTDVVAALVAKSLVMADFRAAEPNYYLLGTTRAYALSKLTESGEMDTVRQRYADCCRSSAELALPDPAAGVRAATRDSSEGKRRALASPCGTSQTLLAHAQPAPCPALPSGRGHAFR
jgi:predicted ATPase/DNA-binding winged helix-turn-helix (wHTH) protein